MSINLSRRPVLGAFAGAVAGAVLSRPVPTTARARFDATVGPGDHATVAEALKAAPASAERPFRILVREGIWKEKLTIDKPFIHLIGEGRGKTTLVFDAAAGLRSPDGSPWGTSRSASLTITAPDCLLADLTIANSFDYLEARRTPGPAGAGLQALALSVAGRADRTQVRRATITGWQDTLLVNAGRSFLEDCEISGCVDFIFGAGTAFFETCTIRSRARTIDGRQGVLTAPSTPGSRTYGLIFNRCRLEKEAGMTAGSVALGRPWRPTADAVGQSVFLDCWMDDHIGDKAWDAMAYGRAPGGGYLWFQPEQARFFEEGSRGPGASTAKGRRRLSADEARFFARAQVLGDWKPKA